MKNKKYRLLYIDDQLLEEPYLVVPIEEEGFQVIAATTGKGALERLAKETFDAVLLDNMMAGGEDEDSEWAYDKTENALRTGLMVLEHIEMMSTPPPVWILTALPDTETEVREKNSPVVVDYIRKEFSLGELARRIRVHLDHKENSM